MISRTISGEEQQAGAPDGLILIPTMSWGSTNFAQAACADFSPVNSCIACSSIWCTIGCETRFPTMAFRSRSSITRPGRSPGMPSGEALYSGKPWSSMGGTVGGVTSAGIAGSSPCISTEALPIQPALTKVRRSMRRFPDRQSAAGRTPKSSDQITIGPSSLQLT